ncbi:MAG: phBC6A51 family helix-turn-helix protein [Bacillota bacterium]
MVQNATEKRLTPTERRLIEALLDPSNRLKSISEICDMVNCSRKTYYRAFDKPHFREEYKRRAAALSERHLGQVMNAFVKEATRGSFQHGKVLLEMAGVYSEKTKHEHFGPDGGPIPVTLEDLQERFCNANSRQEGTDS